MKRAVNASLSTSVQSWRKKETEKCGSFNLLNCQRSVVTGFIISDMNYPWQIMLWITNAAYLNLMTTILQASYRFIEESQKNRGLI